MSGELLVIAPDGRCRTVPNSYEGIKDGLDGATLDAVTLPDNEHCLFVDDDGMVTGLALNVPASLLSSMALYGPVVLTGAPDDEGETQPPSGRMMTAAANMALCWRRVNLDATAKGQDLTVMANAATVPAPEIVALSNEEFDAWLRGER
jgi:Domain of unknown function (DUF3846)